MRVSSYVRLAAGFMLAIAGSTTALAADAQAFATRLKAVADAQGIAVAFASATSEGDDVILKGFSAGTGPNATPPADVTFKSVSGSPAEGWTVASVPLSDIDRTEGPTRIKVKDVGVRNFKFSGTDASTLPGGNDIFFDAATLGSLSIEQDGKQSLLLTGMTLKNSVSDVGAIETEADLGDLSLDFDAMTASPEAKQAMKALGYSEMKGTGSLSGSWDPKKGELALNPLTMTVENAGSLDFSYQINGYTPAFMTSMNQIRQQIAANPKTAEMSGMAILGLLSQLSIASTEIVYTDDSLTNKLLDYYGKENGQSRGQMIETLISTLPSALAPLQNPDFEKQVTEAVSTFLKDPKSLIVAVDPQSPVPATAIMGAAMGAPQSLPAVLSLSVTANADE